MRLGTSIIRRRTTLKVKVILPLLHDGTSKMKPSLSIIIIWCSIVTITGIRRKNQKNEWTRELKKEKELFEQIEKDCVNRSQISNQLDQTTKNPIYVLLRQLGKENKSEDQK